MSFPLVFLPSDPSHDNDSGLLAACSDRLLHEYILTHPDGSTWTFSAYLHRHDPPWVRIRPAMWADSGLEGRRAMATALFARIEVEGYQRMEYERTPEAIELGLSGALPAVIGVGAQIGEFGRGERDSPFVTHVRARPSITLVNRTRMASGPLLALASA